MQANIEYGEGHAVVASRNDTAFRLPSERLITEAFLAYAEEHPEKVAIIDGADQLTYREAVERCSRVSDYINRMRVPGSSPCVGIYLEPSIELMVAIWGTMLAGSAYLPLSPEYPDERIRYMIQDSQVPIVVVQEKFRAAASRLAPAGTRVVSIEALQDSSPAPPPRLAERFVHPRSDSLAYVIYTSGSTGKPNGVMIEHGGLANQMHWLKTECGLDESAVILQKTPMSFDAAQCEILALSCGSTVVMGAPGIYRNTAGIIETIVRSRATHAIFVPTLLQALLDTDELSRCVSLTHIYCGGEALPKRVAADCILCLPEVKLINMYGPTECTINTSALVVDAAVVADGPDVVSIGAPIINTEYYILNESGRLAAVGEIGELYIAGVGLARGYLHREALTKERFLTCRRQSDGRTLRLYKSGDLGSWDETGAVQYVGRSDTQVKLRGYRVELDEIRSQIEKHSWVKRAAVVVKTSTETGYQNLIAYVELDPKNAALMDQNHQSAHHRSKKSRNQVLMQISNPGSRDPAELAGRMKVKLPGEKANGQQLACAFARKTYRFFEGLPTSVDGLLRALAAPTRPPEGRAVHGLSIEVLGEILRYFGAFSSKERLLPKFAYASPGALYATQMYLELVGHHFLSAGIYYFDPYSHELVLIRNIQADEPLRPRMKLHFIGKRRAIEPVYVNNIREVLEIEVGHMIGLFEHVLPQYGFAVSEDAFDPAHKLLCDVDDTDFYLGSFKVAEDRGERLAQGVDYYLQSIQGGASCLEDGFYSYDGCSLHRVSASVVRRSDVIAINQAVYGRAEFGVAIVSQNRDWTQYINLGRALQRLQMGGERLGFMSAGYSSKTGNDLPAATRIREILAERGVEVAASYFAVGGGVSPEQMESQGMNEDIVHMKGPAEMLTDDLASSLPLFMVPNQVILIPEMPLTANGKIDVQNLRSREVELVRREHVSPRSVNEEAIHALWVECLKRSDVSVTDNFFELGGNSLIAVRLTNEMNARFGAALPLQVIFEAPTIEKLADKIGAGAAVPSSRLIPLQRKGRGSPVFCWPGLGGYCMNMRQLAQRLGTERPFYGIQAQGINVGEEPYRTVEEMSIRDVELIKGIQAKGPYRLWGYSFGARVAFETAYQLESQGDTVENLVLIAPGSPIVRGRAADRGSGYANEAYVSILFSVFTGDIHHPKLPLCLATVKSEEDFVEFVASELTGFDPQLVRRILKVASRTFEFRYSFGELKTRRVCAPVTIIRATGDDYSFIEGSEGYSSLIPTIIGIQADHYGILREPGVDELVRAVQGASRPIGSEVPRRGGSATL